jgi:hypothetical protein
MRLIIREYLSLLKEDGELDAILPTLLLAMNIVPLSSAQKGVRQDGVDVSAVGKDENGIKTLFLFLVKQGDLSRNDWDSGPQSVRQSLNDIKDVYLNNRVNIKHQKLPKKIIVSTGGSLKQNVESGWNGYIQNYQVDGELEYEFWGGDKLSSLIEEYLFNEKVIPEALQNRFRKSLVLLSDPSYDLSDYYFVLDELLLNVDFGDLSKQSSKKKMLKALRTINICQNIVYSWAKSEDNLKPAIYCAERTVLHTWDFIRRNNLYGNQKVSTAFWDNYNTLLSVYTDYFLKIQDHCYVENGFAGYGHHYLEECLSVFEHLGLISNAGLLYLFLGAGQQNKANLQDAKNISHALKHYITNHPATSAPCYDGHIIEISQAILLLSSFGEGEFVKNWIIDIINNVTYSYGVMGKYFPIDTDSFDELLEVCIEGAIKKEEAFKMSTLLPILAQWCLAFNLTEPYQGIVDAIGNIFPECTLQIWYPDEETEDVLYKGYAGQTGAVEAPMSLDRDIATMIDRVIKLQNQILKPEKISAFTHGQGWIPLMASRHFRSPLIPIYWQKHIIDIGANPQLV